MNTPHVNEYYMKYVLDQHGRAVEVFTGELYQCVVGSQMCSTLCKCKFQFVKHVCISHYRLMIYFINSEERF